MAPIFKFTSRYSFLFVLLFLFAFPSVRLLLAADAWPEYRGPTFDGNSTARGLPLRWSEQKNIRWKTTIHGRAWSSPVVLDKQVWLTTATADGKSLLVVCVDQESGQTLLDREVFQVETPRPLSNRVNSYATPSPVIESGRVYVHFGSYGTACLDTHTFEVLWQRRDLPCDHWRGPASSPLLFEDMIVLHMDGANVQYVVALDKMTGVNRWVSFRSAPYGDLEDDGRPRSFGDYRKAYNTAFAIEFDGKPQLISPSAKAAYAYDPETGRELWRIRHDRHSTAPRTLYSNGIAYINIGLTNPELWAVRVDGRGDVTSSHVKWKCRKTIPSRSSPVLVDGHIYMISEKGIASCVDIQTGDQVWQARVGGTHSASMVHAHGRIHFFSEEGETTIIKPGMSFEVLARNQLDDGFMASPAIVGKAFYLRTRKHLYRVEER